MVRVKDIFYIKYGVSLELQNCDFLPLGKGGIPFVSRTSKNNGIVSYVEPIEDVTPNPANTISVACGGSVLSSFYQEIPYYSGFHILYLLPKKELTKEQIFFYCMILQKNAYKYNYGRQANRTLPDILIPDISEISKDFLNTTCKIPEADSISNELINIDATKWKTFKYGGQDGVFIIKNGYYNKKPEKAEQGNIPFIGATEYNNGITEWYSKFDIENNHKDERSLEHSIEEKIFKRNCITVSNNGSVGYAFYQEKDFSCSHDINVLYLKNGELNKYIAMFMCTLISLERYRWAYGRKWRPVRMPKSEIKLPVNSKGQPNWKFMENYIKSLPYSKSI